MKKTLLLLFLLNVALGSFYAQNAASFKIKERKGIRINKKIQESLLNKTWTSYKQYQMKGRQGTLHSGNYFALKLTKDNQFQVSSPRHRQNGEWKVNGKTLRLRVTEDVKTPKSSENFINGDYIIYKITEDEMLLVKKANNPDASSLLYYCKGAKTNELGNAPMVSILAQQAQADKEKKEKDALVKEIEMEWYLRGEKNKQNLNKMTNKELIQLRDKILSGAH